jgi:hypothetical protein
MFNLPNTPVNSVIAGATIGVLAVTAFIAKKKSDDQQHLVNAHVEMKKTDADMQANMLNIIKEMNNPKL